MSHVNQAGLPGFYDPCVGEEKSLKLLYQFRGAMHQVLSGDTEPLRIPKQCEYYRSKLGMFSKRWLILIWSLFIQLIESLQRRRNLPHIGRKDRWTQWTSKEHKGTVRHQVIRRAAPLHSTYSPVYHLCVVCLTQIP